MKPTHFPGVNTTFAKDQPQYIPLPAQRADDGLTLTCWKASWRERLLVLLSGQVWLEVLTFNSPLQPLRMTASREVWLTTDGEAVFKDYNIAERP